MNKLKTFCLGLVAVVAFASCNRHHNGVHRETVRLNLSHEQMVITQTKGTSTEDYKKVYRYAVQIFENISGEGYLPKYAGIFDETGLANIEFETRADALYKVECGLLYKKVVASYHEDGSKTYDFKDVALDDNGYYLAPFTMTEGGFLASDFNKLVEKTDGYFNALCENGVCYSNGSNPVYYSDFMRFYVSKENIESNIGTLDLETKAKFFFIDFKTQGVPDGYAVRGCIQDKDTDGLSDPNVHRSMMVEMQDGGHQYFFINDFEISSETAKKIYLYVEYCKMNEEGEYEIINKQVVGLDVKKLHEHDVNIKINQTISITPEDITIIDGEDTVVKISPWGDDFQ